MNFAQNNDTTNNVADPLTNAHVDIEKNNNRK
jgi:hypothetical protein